MKEFKLNGLETKYENWTRWEEFISTTSPEEIVLLCIHDDEFETSAKEAEKLVIDLLFQE
jgi:hypothetical protein